MGKFKKHQNSQNNNRGRQNTNNNTIMEQSEVTCPYNFIPLPDPKDIYNPEWSENTYHDIPFEDGESGEIQFTITAEDLIFIRNGNVLEHENNSTDTSFSHYIDRDKKKKYFIPSTSIKGMLRNYIEILSRANFKIINDHRYSFRTIMSNNYIDDVYKLNTDEIKKNIQCGYIKKQNDQFYIYSCGTPYKLRYPELENKYDSCNFSDHFNVDGKANLYSDFKTRTAKYKYEKDDLLKNKTLEAKFKLLPKNDINYHNWTWKKQPLKYVVLCHDTEDNSNNSFYGEIVASGQPFYYGKRNSKEAEYVFKGRKADVIKEGGKPIKKEIVNNFLFINGDNDKARELEDWKFWKNKLNEGIPVFFLLDESGEVESFGLTFLYKQPNKYSVGNLNQTLSNKPDLAETIFGSVEESNQLKGRVFIGHAHASKVFECPQEISYTLSSPRSSFFPFYLNQNNPVTKYNTYEKKSTLRGFKKYPFRKNVIRTPNVGPQNMINKMRPLEKDSEFICKIRFHNLLPAEIGALISGITTHNNLEYKHSLGLGKPFGMGRVKLSNLTLNGLKYDSIYYLERFEEVITQGRNAYWLQSETIKEYLAMSALPSNGNLDSKLNYMEVTKFEKVKRNGLVLLPYSSQINFSGTLKSIKNK